MNAKRRKGYIGATVFCLLFFVLSYYISFPALNIHNAAFWGYLITLSVVVCVSFFLVGHIFPKDITVESGKSRNPIIKFFKKFNADTPFICKVSIIVIAIAVVVPIIGSVLGSPIFRAKDYASLLEIEECDFADNIPESTDIKDIALMDTSSAKILGNRKIGSLSNVVSQYEIEDDYTQINISGYPYKVAPLKYASMFKALKNQGSGITGYVKIDPVKFSASYVELEKGMRYVPSAYLNKNLQRHVQLKYPTKIVYDYYFEVDDEGNPYFVCPTMTSSISLFGAMDVEGVIICDPITGDCTYYSSTDIPAWIDRVYDGELLEEKYNWYGMYSNGYWNSMFSQTGCKQTTDDYGYKTIGDDVWIYTGVTSVNGDESNIGFVMINQRTSQAYYYNVSGAEEYSAMAAAEGEVQEKGYKASFPSLINVAGTPTYIMVLKDNGGLVKMYAMVNVEQYNIVATATSQEKVFAAYKKLLFNNGGNSSKEKEEQKEKIITVADIQFISQEGATTVYIKDTEHQVYKQAFADNETLIKICKGDNITVTYEEMEDGIHYMTDFSFVKEEKEANLDTVSDGAITATE